MYKENIYKLISKNFKKINFIIFLLCSYVFYKTINLLLLMTKLTTIKTSYNKYTDPTINYLKPELFIIVAIIIIIALILKISLSQNGKKTKLYKFTIISCLLTYIIFSAINVFLNNYVIVNTSLILKIFIYLLLLILILETILLLTYIFRSLGLGIKKLIIPSPEKLTPISEEDKIIQKNRTKRLQSYYYKENKQKIINVIVVIILLVTITLCANFLIINKTYKEKEHFNANGYTITINKSYYTKKDNDYKVISQDSAFIILDVTIENNQETRYVDLDYFHITNKKKDYITTYNNYASSFDNLGTSYDSKLLKQGQKLNQIIIFKVDSIDKLKDFKMYYQDVNKKISTKKKVNIKLKKLD